MTNGDEKISNEMKELLENQREIEEWLDTVNNRIFELEDKYLLETPHGNVIKGWEIDGKMLPNRGNKLVEDKDRLFTYSSVNAWANFPLLKEKRKIKVENKQRKHVRKSNSGTSSKRSSGVYTEYDENDEF